MEKDPLAIEVCRLLLTLSDYPNDNSWQLHHRDAFDWLEWDTALKSASVVLANPPYEPFPAEERKRVRATKAQPPAEFIYRLMRQPPAMLGLVLPQSFLSSPFYQDANRQIAQRYADVSIIELPKLFKYEDNETVAVLASGRRDAGKHVSIYYAEVLPGKAEEFLADFKVSAERTGKLDATQTAKDFTLWIPPKGSIFDNLQESLSPLHAIGQIHQGIRWRQRKDGKPKTAPRTDVVSDREKVGFFPGAEKMAGNLTQFLIRTFRNLSLREEDQWPRDKAWKLPWTHPKAVCNRSRFERHSPWRIAPWADEFGRVFTQQFIAVWPTSGVSEFAIAAVLASPIANAFCFERDLNPDNRITTLEALPVPDRTLLGPDGDIHKMAKRIQSLLSPRDFAPQPSEKEIAAALIRLDAAVLEAYDLPARVQRQLLNQFQGWKRPVAVPFTGYFPDHFKDAITLKDFVAIQYDWEDETNERRCDLIEKELSRKGLEPEERVELEHLQHLADLLVRLKAPYPLEELGSLVTELKAKGKWKPST